MIQAIIIDLGGVLLRTNDFSDREKLASKYNMTLHDLEKLVFYGESGKKAQRGEITASEHWNNVFHVLGIEGDESQTFMREFWKNDGLDYELIDFMRKMRGRYKTALLSNAFSDLRPAIKDHWKFDDAFDVMVISSEVGRTKPDPFIYHHTLELLEIEPHQAIFIDDFIENVHSAQELGIHAIHFQNTADTLEAVRSLLDQGD